MSSGEIVYDRECQACGATTYQFERCHECGDVPWKHDHGVARVEVPWWDDLLPYVGILSGIVGAVVSAHGVSPPSLALLAAGLGFVMGFFVGPLLLIIILKGGGPSGE